jgi:hypothetical protein
LPEKLTAVLAVAASQAALFRQALDLQAVRLDCDTRSDVALRRGGGNISSVSVASDLRQRVVHLRSRLDVLLERREVASRVHSFAEARQDAGVTHLDADEMDQLAHDETAGDAEVTALRREIRSVEDGLERDRDSGLKARAGRVLRAMRRR